MDGVGTHSGVAAAPLNVFQRLVMQWDRIHPYNAAQLLKLAGPAPVAELSASWQDTLCTLGLGRVEVQGRRVHHYPLNGEFERYPLTVVPPGESLWDHISAGLNRPFDQPGEAPFRPFMQCCGDHHYAGVVYQHWVADSVSIRLLLREWFYRIHDPPRARRTPLPHATGGYSTIFSPWRANWRIGDALLSSMRWSSHNRRVARIEHPDYDDFAIRFTPVQMGDQVIDPLLHYARRAGVTVNDLFLATMAEVCHQYLPLRRTSRRRDMALGTIVDLRGLTREDLSETFGLFLGFTTTLCRPDDLNDFARLLRTVARQSRQHKAHAAALSSPLRMLVGLTVGRFFSQSRMIEFYRKRVPLAGGISNVNLNRSWAASYHPAPLLDYIRVSPTGPLMPLVFTPTTLGKNLHFGLTYRPALIDEPAAQQIAQHFVTRLRGLAQEVA